MDFPAHIFKAYDIRGIYPTELHEELIYKIGQAYAELLKKEVVKDKLTVVVGRDMRESSPALVEALIKGVAAQGVDVVDIGLVSTPTFYFGVSYFGYDGGLQISASHNPSEYNGVKLVRGQARSVSGDDGINEVRDLTAAGAFPAVITKGTITTQTGVLEGQINYALSTTDVSKIKPFHVVIDAANGMGAPLMEELFKYLPGKLTKMFFELDGRFPNHEADPLKDENNKMLQDKVREVGADLGIALDGDADRVFFVDNTGATIHPAIMRGILARIFLKERPGATICYDIRPGRITRDMIEEAGGIPVVTRVGHSLIKAKAREVGAVFAGESSGHFFVNMPHGMFEAPEIITLKFLQELSVSGKKASEYIAPYKKYHHSGEINFNVQDKAGVFTRLREQYGQCLSSELDGLSFDCGGWWFNVRASNTENKVRLTVEGKQSDTVAAKVAELSDLITLNT